VQLAINVSASEEIEAYVSQPKNPQQKAKNNIR